MARGESRSSNGSQFFIVTNKEDQSDGLAIQYYPEKIIEQYKKGGTPKLDGEYTVFGQVIEGMDTVDKIASGEVKDGGSGEKSTPVEPAKVTEVKVLQEPKK
jgi:peptidyl-prolyl cis-trans isomerase A (cyclophilin A)